MFDDEFSYRHVEAGHLVREDTRQEQSLAKGPAEATVWPGSAEMAWRNRNAARSS